MLDNPGNINSIACQIILIVPQYGTGMRFHPKRPFSKGLLNFPPGVGIPGVNIPGGGSAIPLLSNMHPVSPALVRHLRDRL